jgi:hypothetical protein
MLQLALIWLAASGRRKALDAAVALLVEHEERLADKLEAAEVEAHGIWPVYGFPVVAPPQDCRHRGNCQSAG